MEFILYFYLFYTANSQPHLLFVVYIIKKPSIKKPPPTSIAAILTYLKEEERQVRREWQQTELKAPKSLTFSTLPLPSSLLTHFFITGQAKQCGSKRGRYVPLPACSTHPVWKKQPGRKTEAVLTGWSCINLSPAREAVAG